MVFTLRLIADVLRATERVEAVVCRTIASQELIVGETLHRLGLIESDLSIVDAVAGLALVAHRVRVTKIDRRAIAHEALHAFHVHLSLVQASKGRNFDLRLQARVGAEAKRRRGRVARIPEVIASFLYAHIDTGAASRISRVEQFLIEPAHGVKGKSKHCRQHVEALKKKLQYCAVKCLNK